MTMMLLSVLIALVTIIPVHITASTLPTTQDIARRVCDVSSERVPSLPGFSTDVPGLETVNIAIGTGTQNYTCTNGKFTSIGAVALLQDISCTHDTPQWEDTQENFNVGVHFFITNPQTGTGISPYFEKTQKPYASAVVAKVANHAAPNSTADIDWLRLDEFQGGWAQTIFRVQTRGGQPPANCEGNETIAVPYHAQYWFLN